MAKKASMVVVGIFLSFIQSYHQKDHLKCDQH